MTGAADGMEVGDEGRVKDALQLQASTAECCSLLTEKTQGKTGFGGSGGRGRIKSCLNMLTLKCLCTFQEEM